ncbi:MAG: phenylalanine--tRNA ligase subunit alpha [Bacteroidales bacterium]|nr:phenylalanine--tRNA ligase subunit alpha [Bacteroidales bacterium]
MQEKIDRLLEEIQFLTASSREGVEQLRLKYLSKKGLVPLLFEEFRSIPKEQKKVFGQQVNELKSKINRKLDELDASFEDNEEAESPDLDMTRPVDQIQIGSRHPLSIVRNQILGIFSRIGYTVAEGPEIESDWYNFSALNFPAEHPAKDMQDTYFIEKDPDMVLRTHTSSVQVRVMETTIPPIRKVFPGRVFRNEAISARAHCIFHQVEGLYVDENVSFSDLKQSLFFFAREMFGEETKIRLRPSFFPFTEPSGELDISCNICEGNGCNICKYTGWVEILGCGMVDPQVLANCKIDPEKYTGFAFGMGIERIAMLKYQINDLRLFFENDIRFLKQFQGTC